jgi:hypothetical protein
MYLQLAEDNYLAASCGLPPVKPIRSRSKAPDKWATYDRKRAEWEACREGKGKPTSIHPFKKVLLAPGRALFYLMLDRNIDGVASRLATMDIQGLSRQWTKLGGEPNKLVKFINQGKKKAPHRRGLLTKFTGPQTLGEGEETEENPAALSKEQKTKIIAATSAFGVALAAAIPVTAPVAIPGGPILGTVIVGVMPFIKGAANKNAAEEAAGALVPDAPVPAVQGTDDEQTDVAWMDKTNFLGFTNKQTVLVGGSLAVIGGIIYIAKNRR